MMQIFDLQRFAKSSFVVPLEFLRSSLLLCCQISSLETFSFYKLCKSLQITSYCKSLQMMQIEDLQIFVPFAKICTSCMHTPTKDLYYLRYKVICKDLYRNSIPFTLTRVWPIVRPVGREAQDF